MKAFTKAIMVLAMCLLGIIGMGYFVLDSMFSGMCGNEQYTTLFSPDKAHKAVVFQRDCGATTGFTTQVSVLDADQELENESGNVLVSSGKPSELPLELIWVDSTKLLVKGTSEISPSTKDHNVSGVEIKYE
jgi:hypothetical protein